MIKYDVYMAHGVYYRIRIDSNITTRPYYYSLRHGCWTPSAGRAIDVIGYAKTKLIARNVVFKASLCSQ